MSTSLNEAIARVLRRERLAQGLSQEALADRADIDRTYVSAIEGGSRNITLDTVEGLARALERSPASLLRLVIAELGGGR